MTVHIRSKADKNDQVIQAIVDVLEEYHATHRSAKIEIYRQNNVSIRIRVIDSAFKGLGHAEREKDLWNAFDQLPDEVVSEISLLILLTPEEAKTSLANMEFDDPLPSKH